MQRMALRSSIVGRAIRSVTCRRREIFGVTSGSDGELGRQFLSFSTAAASQKPSSSVDTGLVRLVQSEIDSIEHQRQVSFHMYSIFSIPICE
ncbi:hypothetical protein M5689_009880 [Euphorbia peplus]|nr:hypothetical protein M5689_009880 [Euphorbia peplus]